MIDTNQRNIVARTKEFCETSLQPIARELDQESRFPTELLAQMGNEGFFGLNYPVEYGGMGYDAVTSCEVITVLARASAGLGVTLNVHGMAVDVLLRFGTTEQKEKYLPDLLQGRKVAAYTLSEVQAGSDTAAIKATAVQEEDGWLLNGAKYFCTNGGLADIYLVALKTSPEAGARGISMFIVEKGTPGFQIGRNEEKLGCRSSVTTSLVFKDCRIPQENLVGKLDAGFKIGMFGLIGGRLGMAATGLGIAEAAMAAAVEYAKRRVTFGKHLQEHYAIQAKLADMYVQIEAAKLLIAETARKRDSGQDYALDTSVAKLFVARMVTEICHESLQVFGGHGYMKYNDPERYLRDARIVDIGVGASEVLKMVVGTAVAQTKTPVF